MVEFSIDEVITGTNPIHQGNPTLILLIAIIALGGPILLGTVVVLWRANQKKTDRIHLLQNELTTKMAEIEAKYWQQMQLMMNAGRRTTDREPM